MDRRKTENPERIFSEQQTQPTYGVNTKPLNPWPHWWEASAYPRLASNQPHELTAEKLQSKWSEVFRQRSGPASNEIASTILNRRKDFLESLCHPCYPKYILLRGRIKKLSHQLYGNIMESFSPLVVWKNLVCDLHGHVFIHNDELNIVIITCLAPCPETTPTALPLEEQKSQDIPTVHVATVPGWDSSAILPQSTDWWSDQMTLETSYSGRLQSRWYTTLLYGYNSMRTLIGC